MTRINSWREDAWEDFLTKFWDNRPEGIDSVLYTTDDLESILKKYTKSGQGEIRIFHYGHEKVTAVKKRGVVKIPVSRKSWKIVKKRENLSLDEPSRGGVFEIKQPLTEGMILGIKETFNLKTNPGETTLLAIANHAGIIEDFYNLRNHGVLFTGGRQRAGITLNINGESVDMSKAQIEIDGGFEWPDFVVIVEMKSSFRQENFDINQAVIPYLKWKNILKNKTVKSLVLLAQTRNNSIEYWAYDIGDISNKEGIKAKVNMSKKYLIKL
jgi:hypothetical protein